jgi:Na+-translocating ferredoxin:NAD+ oxidoreductase subunit C
MFFNKSFGLKGIKPEDYKYLTSHKKIESAYIPNIAYIPLHQNGDAPAKPIVEIGQKVEEGQLIAVGDGITSLNVHSSIPGKIAGFFEKKSFTGKPCNVIKVELEGEFRKTGKIQEKINWQKYTKDKILNIINDYGITGFGNILKYVKSKLKLSEDLKIATLIINASESEPFITCDHRIIVDRGEEIIEGINIINKVLEAKNVFIGISNNKKNAINHLKHLCHQKNNYKIVSLTSKYPQGDEKLIIKSITGKKLSIDRNPIDSGIVVLNISTILAVCEAIVIDKPFIERAVTVSGSGINTPQNLKIKIGTLVKDIIEECGGLKPDVKRIIIGGPMMGFAQNSLDIPISKNCTAIIALTEEEIKEPTNSVCINCGKCIKSCPFGLMPNKIYGYLKNNMKDKAVELGLNFCTTCGSCSWICPSKINLSQLFKDEKKHNIS